MHLLLIIAGFLVGSSILQGVGFYVYSQIYKKRFMRSALQQEVADDSAYLVSSQNAGIYSGSATGSKTEKSGKLSVVRSERSNVLKVPSLAKKVSLVSVGR